MASADRDFFPHVTVATVIEQDGRLLFVEEMSQGERVINQPAGHLEPNESLVEAAVRETLEETGWHVAITGLLGVALYRSEQSGETYHRTTFVGKTLQQHSNATLDPAILATHWLTLDEARAHAARPRSPLVLHFVEQYLQGQIYPANIVI
ncbi:MAG: NUDIX hydrolase [Gammaproteobacteria bacterium]|nr:NUDIX hydrolase [Gammaproteobacteria bacterium]NND40112.1 NUDIX hydrolase [Pseudomonadales bacterium]MBT8151099.1 NUDIX hydrolase [Gammaproteobacteria bacterium]NNL10529.1 NUDIX hydrolase [Pseudomonadales bacterium]NNM12417.1 NUDIX hydrolase [Pseudomonadales bacterium]